MIIIFACVCTHNLCVVLRVDDHFHVSKCSSHAHIIIMVRHHIWQIAKCDDVLILSWQKIWVVRPVTCVPLEKYWLRPKTSWSSLEPGSAPKAEYLPSGRIDMNRRSQWSFGRCLLKSMTCKVVCAGERRAWHLPPVVIFMEKKM